VIRAGRRFAEQVEVQRGLATLHNGPVTLTSAAPVGVMKPGARRDGLPDWTGWDVPSPSHSSFSEDRHKRHKRNTSAPSRLSPAGPEPRPAKRGSVANRVTTPWLGAGGEGEAGKLGGGSRRSQRPSIY
jgi:hypothetical protein